MTGKEIRPGRYRHFKGGEYEVLGVARHSETEEAMVEFPRYSSSGIYRSVTFSAAGITVPADSNMTSEGVQFSYAAFY